MREVSPTPRLNLTVAVLTTTCAVLWWVVCVLMQIGLTLIGAIVGSVVAYRAMRRAHEWS